MKAVYTVTDVIQRAVVFIWYIAAMRSETAAGI